MPPDAPPPVRILFESPAIRVVYQPADSDLLVYSFNGLDFRGRGKLFFGNRFFAKRGLAAVGIVDNNQTWYPHAEMLKAVDAILAVIPVSAYARRLAYGVSMGGYAALKYSARLHADASLAFGPQWSIDPDLVGRFDQRYAEFFHAGIHSGVSVTPEELCRRNYVVYDPVLPPDREHGRILARSPKVHLVNGSFLGHPGIAFFARARLLEGVLRLAAEQETPDPLAVRRLVRQARADSPEYWLGRATRLHRTKGLQAFDRVLHAYSEARRLAIAAPEGGESLDSLIGLAELMLDAHRNGEAARYLEQLWATVAGGGYKGLYNRDLMELFLRANSPWRAQKVARLGLQREPNNASIRLDLVKALLASGEHSRANAEIDAARQQVGARPRLWKRLSWLYGQLGRRGDAVAARDAMGEVLLKRISPTAPVRSIPSASPSAQPASSRLN